jgi:hypothetical protein
MTSHAEDYIIIIDNKEIWNFYNNNKNINIESANLLMIKFVESMFNHLTEDQESNINSQILSFMNENRTELGNIKTNIATIHESLSKINSEVLNTMSLQFMHLKKDYIEDVKQIITNSSLTTYEKIDSLVDKNTGHLLDKTTLILNDILPKNQEHLNRQISENLRQFHQSITQETNQLAKSMNQEGSLTEFITSFDQKYNAVMQNIQQPLYTFFTASEERINKNIDALKESSTQSLVSKNKVLDDLGEFLGKYKGSSNKGKFGEQNLHSILNTLYSNAEIINTSGTKASGDFIMKRVDKPSILFENKDYDYNIPKDEIAKFIRDVDTQNMHGIFSSQYSGIAFKQNFQIDINKGNVLVYIQHCEYSLDKIRIAVDIIDSLAVKLQDLNMDEDGNTISKEILDEINQEYQGFITQKETMTTLLKDFTKKMNTQIEDIRLPCLDKYLSQKYAYVKANSFNCDICNAFSASTKQSLAAHKRSCSKKSKSENIVVETTARK